MLVAKQLLHSWERGMANETYNVITRRPIDEPLQEPPVSDPSKGKRQPKLDPKNPNESPFREPDPRRPPRGDFSVPHSPRHRFSVGGAPGANTLNTNSELESRSEKSFLHLARFATLYLH